MPGPSTSAAVDSSTDLITDLELKIASPSAIKIKPDDDLLQRLLNKVEQLSADVRQLQAEVAALKSTDKGLEMSSSLNIPNGTNKLQS